MAVPYEVSYTTQGRNKWRTREVVAIMCPTSLALRLSRAGITRPFDPILINLGDAVVHWDRTTPGYDTLYELGILTAP